MAEKQVPADCIANVTNAKCVKVGINIPALGVDIGDSLDYVLEKLAGVIDLTPNDDQDDTVDANMYCLGGSGSSLCVSQIVNKTIRYGCTINSIGEINFAWDMSDIRSALPSGFSIISSSIVINGTKSTLPLLSTNNINSSVVINPSEYPVVADMKIRITSPCGQIELLKTINLYNTAEVGDKIAIMDVRDYTTGSAQDLTVKAYRELVNREMCSVKDRILLLEAPDYEAQIQQLLQKVASLEEKLTEAESKLASL